MKQRRSFRHVPSDGQYPALPLDPIFAGDYDFKLAGLHLRVHAREFLDRTQWDDEDWLWVTAHYKTLGASVWTCGPIMLTSEFPRFLNE
jgi:hypothetical protein